MTENAPWAQTASGMAVDLLTPSPHQIRLVDISYALSCIPRFNGHARPSWSVASHSMLVESLMPREAAPELRLAALMHDAAEAYTGDITTPMKHAMEAICGFNPLSAMEPGLRKAINLAAGLDPFERGGDQIKTADLLALAIEKRDLMTPMEWGLALPDVSKIGLRIIPQTQPVADSRFRSRFRQLMIAGGVLPMASFMEGL